MITNKPLAREWEKDFEDNFGHHPEMQLLKLGEIHGKLEINFTDSVPINYNFTIHRRRQKAQP